jgi:excisionase family DNA binding protein
MSEYYSEVEPMLTTAEVARMLNVHINTVRRWSNQGSLASYRLGSRGDRRFRKSDIDEFFARAKPNGNGDNGDHAEETQEE